MATLEIANAGLEAKNAAAKEERDAAAQAIMDHNAADTVNRLDLLPQELLLIVFELIRLTRPLNGSPSMPLSKSLQPLLQINLYHTIRINSVSQLSKLYESLSSPAQESIGYNNRIRGGTAPLLGHLIHHLELMTGDLPLRTDYCRPVSRADLLHYHVGPQLKTIKSSRDASTGNTWLGGIAAFPRLQIIEVSTTTGMDYMDTLKLKDLKELKLELNSSIPARETRQLRNKSNQRQLSLDKLSLTGFFSLRVFEFLKAIQATQITLQARDKCDTITPALLALDPSSTTHLRLSALPIHSANPYILLHLQLQPFSQLQQLAISQSAFKASRQFFTGLFKNCPLLQALKLGIGFDLNAGDLIDGLKSLAHLNTPFRRIILDHLSEKEYFPVQLDEADPFPRHCNMDQLDNLVRLTKAKEIKLGGSTLDALDYYRLGLIMLEQEDDAADDWSAADNWSAADGWSAADNWRSHLDEYGHNDY